MQIISEKYGSPSFTRYVDLSDLDKGHIFWSHRWNEDKIGENKEISIGFYRNKKINYCVMYIDYLPIVKKIEEEEEQKKKEELSNSTDDF